MFLNKMDPYNNCTGMAYLSNLHNKHIFQITQLDLPFSFNKVAVIFLKLGTF